MAPSMRKAVGVVKDQTSISLAKVASNMAPDLEVAIVKATSHDDDPAGEKYIRQILTLTSYSRAYVDACISAVSRRLGKTRDWVVAVKALMLVHRLMSDGDPIFQREMLYATRRGTRLLNMSDFRDEAHSNSWDHSGFVRTYALYLDQRLELMLFERKQGFGAGGRASGSGHGGEIVKYEPREDRFSSPPSRYVYDYGGGDDYWRPGMRRSRSFSNVGESSGQGGEENNKAPTPLRDMKPERILAKMGHLQRLMDRFLACRPTGFAKSNRLILIALYPIVRESSKLYADICEVLAVLLDKFFDMEYPDCVKAFDAYSSAAKQIDELVGFYNWCKDTGVARSSEYPEIQMIANSLLETLEEFLRDRAKKPKSPERKPKAQAPPDEPVQDMNEIKALPAPESTPPPPPPPEPQPKPQPKVEADLVDLKEDNGSADDQGNKLALALFAGSSANDSWQAFPTNGEPEVTSAWQTPAAEPGKADWELALVESASNLAKQKAGLGGGFDPLLLNGMYDQGIVRQHASTAQLTGGSASSIALPGPGKSTTPVLALPGPDGSVQPVGQDPFAASLSFPPPAFVQMADMEKKQQFLTQEQMVWQQYARDGMQGQSSLSKISANGGYYAAPGAAPMMMPGAAPMMPYGMPPVNGMTPPGGYGYYTRL